MADNVPGTMYEATQWNKFYQSHPITNGTRDIRLLSLQPGNFIDPIKCKIQKASLDQEGLEYETLSYVWGQSAIRSSILVDDQITEVTTNLGDALRYLRKTDKTIVLWVDALCINQSNKVEKTHQVGMMGEIYRMCSAVNIWLGCDEYTISNNLAMQNSDPFEIFRHFAESKHLYELPNFIYNNGKNQYEYVERKSVKPESHNDAWTGFHKITQSPWWSRLWTVQEAVLPPKAQVLYGPWSISWDVFISYYINGDRHRKKCCFEALYALPEQLFEQYVSSMYQVNYISTGRKIMQHSSKFPLFYEIVLAGNSKLATEPQDKVLGLLGLANSNIYGNWTPDYALNPEKIYESVFRMMIQECAGSLVCFLGSWFGSGGLTSQEASHLQTVQFPSTPSWVPNFAISMDRRRYIAERNRLTDYDSYHAALDTKLKLSFGHDSSLQISGQPFATVRLVNDLPQQWRNAEDLTQKCLQIVKSINTALGCKDPKSILQAILADAFGSYSSTRKFDVDGEAFLSDNSLKNADAVTDIAGAICGRSFLATEDGAMGLGPMHAKAGDEVWIFSGGNVPFIVRPLTGENDGFYQFVGDCYLQGIMHGEAFDSGRLSEENERQIIIK